MKARIIKTGEIIEVLYSGSGIYLAAYKRHKQYSIEELEILEDYKESIIDWEQRRFELVKAIIPGILSNELLITRLEKTIPEIQDEGNIDVIASLAIGYADAVIKELKEE